jgi:hypothetical protein
MKGAREEQSFLHKNTNKLMMKGAREELSYLKMRDCHYVKNNKKD